MSALNLFRVFSFSIILLLSSSLAVPRGGETRTDDSKEKILVYNAEKGKLELVDKMQKSDEEWKKILTPEQFHVTREKGTERAFTGQYWNHSEPGTYQCVACGADLFASDTKYDAGCGWPSFWDPASQKNIRFEDDPKFGMRRIEVLCVKCGAHLGHVFDDGPKPTGKRYCINSASLKFVKKPGR